VKLPVIQGVIRRRLLVNFRVDPQVMQSHLPARFRPKLHAGSAILRDIAHEWHSAADLYV